MDEDESVVLWLFFESWLEMHRFINSWTKAYLDVRVFEFVLEERSSCSAKSTSYAPSHWVNRVMILVTELEMHMFIKLINMHVFDEHVHVFYAYVHVGMRMKICNFDFFRQRYVNFLDFRYVNLCNFSILICNLRFLNV